MFLFSSIHFQCFYRQSIHRYGIPSIHPTRRSIHPFIFNAYTDQTLNPSRPDTQSIRDFTLFETAVFLPSENESSEVCQRVVTSRPLDTTCVVDCVRKSIGTRSLSLLRASPRALRRAPGNTRSSSQPPRARLWSTTWPAKSKRSATRRWRRSRPETFFDESTARRSAL